MTPAAHERQPNNLAVRMRGWSRIPTDLMPGAGPLTSAWQSGPVCVVSSLTMAELPDGDGLGPQWQISISNRGKRPGPGHVTKALRAFGMLDSEEDNHHPGIARHFWLPVDPAHRVDCECKSDETTVVDVDGYAWQNDPAACRGCEYEMLLGKPCPVHTVAAKDPR